MPNSNHSRPKLNGTPIGYCNACNEYGLLTKDHIFPKSVVPAGEVLITNLEQRHGQSKAKPHRSKKGLYLRTLCARCNNERLGSEYDPAWADLARQTRQVTDAICFQNLSAPSPIALSCQPNRLGRSLVGHSLASMVPAESNAKPRLGRWHRILQSYFLEPEQPQPSGVDILYWFVRPSTAMVLSFTARISMTGAGPMYGSFLRAYPIGFWITLEQHSLLHLPQGLRVLPRATTQRLEESVQIKLDLDPSVPRLWPQTPMDDEAFLLSKKAALYTDNANPTS